MKNLYEPARVAELKDRMAHLGPDSRREWGKMNAPQMLAHCSTAMEWAVGETRPPRMFIGRIIGTLIKNKVVGDDAPIRKNSPTAPTLVITGERDLTKEHQRLQGLLDRFAAAGAAGCTTHPHSFFGRLTPEQWAILMYKHIDHHLRQFGV
jgi:pimeloyl-ACP methyl ester carboxylesterase